MGMFHRLKTWFGAADSEPDDPVGRVNQSLDMASELVREFTVAVNRIESQWLTMQERLRGLEQDVEQSRAKAKLALEEENEASARQWLEYAHERIGKSRELAASLEKLASAKDRMKAEHRRITEQLQKALERRETLLERTRTASAKREAFRAFAHELEGAPFSALRQLEDQVFLQEAKIDATRSPRQALDEELAQLRGERDDPRRKE